MPTEKRIDILKTKKKKQTIRIKRFNSYTLTVNFEPLSKK